MAQYYNPASSSQIQVSSDPHRPSSPDSTTSNVDLDQSIYIFPNPSSLPRTTSRSRSPSVTPSSPLSIPTDFDVLTLGDGWSTSGLSRNTSESGSRVRSVRRVRTISSFSRSISAGDGDGDEDVVEVWDWEDAESVGQRFEEEIERRSRWDVLGPAHTHVHRPALRTLHASSPSSSNISFTLSSVPSSLSLKSRSRSYSHLSKRGRSQSQTQSKPGETPHPAIHIPLLSLLASLFSLDDSTLHILRHTPSSSLLFPSSPYPPSSSSSSGDPVSSDPVHGLPKLFLSSEEENPSKGLRTGLTVLYEKDEHDQPDSETWVVWRWVKWAVGRR